MLAPAAGQGRSTVAVGYDGSEAAQQAVRWAAEYAATLQSPLRVVHAWVWPIFTKNLGPVKGVEGSGLRHSAETILAEGVELARQAYRPPVRAARSRQDRGRCRRPADAGRGTPSTASWKPGSRPGSPRARPGTPASW